LDIKPKEKEEVYRGNRNYKTWKRSYGKVRKKDVWETEDVWTV